MPTLGSNNPFPSILVDESTQPASPGAGFQRLYIDSTDSKLRRVTSSTGVFRFEPQFARKTSDETVTNNSTIQADDELSLSVAASETWEFEFRLHYTTVTAADFKCGLKFPSSPTEISYDVMGPGTDAANSGAVTTLPSMATVHGTADAVGGIVLGGDTNKFTAVLRGYVRNGSNAGTVTAWWAQGTTNASNTVVKAGSWAVGRQLA